MFRKAGSRHQAVKTRQNAQSYREKRKGLLADMRHERRAKRFSTLRAQDQKSATPPAFPVMNLRNMSPKQRFQQIVPQLGNAQRASQAISGISVILRSRMHSPQIMAQGLLEAGFLNYLPGLLDPKAPLTMQRQAMDCCINIACGNTPIVQAFVNTKGVMPNVLRSCLSTDPELAENALWTLGNVVADGPTFRGAALRYGLLNILQKQVNNPVVKIRINVSYLVAICCTVVEDQPLPLSCHVPMLKLIHIGLRDTNVEVVTNAANALKKMTVFGYYQEEEQYAPLCQAGLGPMLMYMVDNPRPEAVRRCGFTVIGRLVACTDPKFTDLMLNLPLMPYLIQGLSSPDAKIRQHVGWIFSNLLIIEEAKLPNLFRPEVLNLFIKLTQDKGHPSVVGEGFHCVLRYVEYRPDLIPQPWFVGILCDAFTFSENLALAVLRLCLNRGITDPAQWPIPLRKQLYTRILGQFGKFKLSVLQQKAKTVLDILSGQSLLVSS